MAILSIIPLLIILLVIIITVKFLNKRSINHSHFISGKKIRWFLLGYIGLLVCSTIFFYILPKDHFVYEQINSHDRDMLNDQTYPDYYDAAQKGRLAELDNIFEKKTWDFDYSDSEIDLSIEGNTHYTIFVERKEINDEVMEVKYYSSKAIVNGIDLTDKVEAPNIMLLERMMFIQSPEPIELNLALFKNEFTIRQFTEEDFIHPSHSFYSMRENIIYIRIPSELKINEKQNSHILFLGE